MIHIESKRIRTGLVYVIIIAMMFGNLAGMMNSYAGEDSYTINFKAMAGGSVSETEVDTSRYILPEIIPDEGYEFSYAVADSEVGGKEPGYKFSEDELNEIIAEDYAGNTTYELFFLLADNDSGENQPDADNSVPVYAGLEEESVSIASAEAPATASVPTVLWNKYEELPENYVYIEKSLSVKDAEVVNTMPNVSLVYGYAGTNCTTKKYFFSYHGTVNYGSANRTAKTNAVTKKNSISGKLVLTWKNKAQLSDETKGDVRITVEDVYFNLGKKKSSKISNSAKVYLPIIGDAGGGKINLLLNTPRTSITTNSSSATYVTGATCQTRRKITIEILKDGQPLDKARYPYMIMGFTDLDVQDHSIASGKSRAALYNGTYAEGITLLSGYYSPVVLAPKTSSNKAMQSTVNTRMIDGKLNIKGDGAKYQELINATKLTEDYNTYYGGFAVPAVPAKSTFYWYGSNGTGGNSTATVIGGQPTVAVKGKRLTVDGSGNALNEDGGTLNRLNKSSEVNDVSSNGAYKSKTYVMNSAVEYKYTPKEGYRVVSLKVDGKDEPFDENGGTYTFTKLNKNPLPSRDPKTGAILAASASSYYSIDVVFEKKVDPVFKATKTSETRYIPSGYEGEIDYEITIDQSVTGAEAGSYVEYDRLADGVLKVVPGSITTSIEGAGTAAATLEEDGIKVTYDTGRNETGKLIVKYKATVDWEKFEELHSGDDADSEANRGTISNVIGDGEMDIDVLSDLILTKTVEGDLRDISKEFEFSVKLEKLRPDTEYMVESNDKAYMTSGSMAASASQSGGDASQTSQEQGSSASNSSESGSSSETSGTGGSGEASATSGSSESGVAATGEATELTSFKSDSKGTAELFIKMKGDGSIRIKGLPYGTEYEVVEESSDHIASFKLTGTGKEPVYRLAGMSNDKNNMRLSTMKERIDAFDGDTTIAFTNTKNAATLTGLPDTIAPYLAGIGAIGGVLLLAGAILLI